MSALVSYASSDGEEDGDDDIQPEKPAKIAKLGEDQRALQSANATSNTRHVTQPAPAINEPAKPPPTPASGVNPTVNPIIGPTQGPSNPPAPLPSAQAATTSTPSSPPQSPYTLTRLQTRSLTLPPHPNFDIPSSPPPPSPGTPAHATLSATTKKFTRFLELKAQGVHFKARLLGSVALTNPGVGGQLMDFAGVGPEEGYASSIWGEGAGAGVPVKWPEECYVEALMEGNERRERKRLAGRGGVEFVPPAGSGTPGVEASKGKGGSASGSANGTPAGGGGGGKKRGVGKR
ncbi:hypothetical protein LTR02_004469 [Friedmanniomyces endolithicus]|nr:hypothetical protein LTR94_006503 [Friedmanniomyces endolithicus]KAK0798932.1 hypothetical protein LTR38_007738 [Friedmanniomyces endolithicus]KAK0803456.1 hypothetical protein LTR59_004663 [Friedmanniomyces endolithicus]KAK0821677.1 hypothetical protein LTR75_000334 [Friedmanniomyces endolithicus]KAK0848044.1 hypothetical protein LTR03_005943 [Friedmanniomyces endolithicus]